MLNNHPGEAAAPGVVSCCKTKSWFKSENKPPGKGKLQKPHFTKPKLKDRQDFTPQRHPGWKTLGWVEVRESARREGFSSVRCARPGGGRGPWAERRAAGAGRAW